jgi:ligand-binding sensor domain-containing protein/signal transduction histidine kinase
MSQKSVQYVTFIFFLLYFSLAHAQEKLTRFAQIYMEQKAANSNVLCIFQDSRGFMWFGTTDGLTKYDGYKFILYEHDKNDSKTLIDNHINSIAEDGKGNLWIGTANGLSKLDYAQEYFTNFFIDSLNPDRNRINTLLIDQKDYLWIGTDGGGLVRFNEIENRFIFLEYTPLKKDPRENAHRKINALSVDRFKQLWLATDYGLFKFDIGKQIDVANNDNFTHYIHNPINNKSIASNQLNSVLADDSGDIWVGTAEGNLNRLDRTTGSFVQQPFQNEGVSDISFININSIYQSADQLIWFGGYGSGLNSIDLRTGKLSRHLSDKSIPFSLNNNDVTHIYEDKAGVLWIATAGGGLNKLDRKASKFDVYFQRDEAKESGLSQRNIKAIWEDKQGNIWIGTANAGLDKYNPFTQKYTHFKNDTNNPNSLSDNRINALLEDKYGNIWIGTNKGLNMLAINGNQVKITRYFSQANNPNQIPNDVITTLTEDKDGNIWIGTLEGLAKYKHDDNSFVIYKRNIIYPKTLSSNAIRCIQFSPQGDLWIGTDGGGLNQMKLKNALFDSFRYSYTKQGSLSDDRVASIYVDEFGKVWVGTLDGGLDLLEVQKGHFSYFSSRQGINSVVYGIIEDKNSNQLWLSGHRGLFRFDIIKQEVTRHYDTNDGLPTEEFNIGAYHKGRSGTYYFGSVNGMITFKPDNLPNHKYEPPIVITDFKAFNESIKINSKENIFLKKHISIADQIHIPTDDYSFSLEFAALHYSAPNRIMYEYKLEGDDEVADKWVKTDALNRVATFNNLPEGMYKFTVRATNADGIMSTQIRTIRINVVLPFWRAWWFRLLVIMAGVGLFFGYYQYRIKNIKENSRKLEKLVAERTQEISQQKTEIEKQKWLLESQNQDLQSTNEKLKQSEFELGELNTTKNRFFSILAHDLRSPMNSMKGFSNLLSNFADQLSPDEIKQTAKSLDETIQISSRYLENLLTWARSQMNSIEFRPQGIFLSEAVANVVEVLKNNANHKSIKLELSEELEIKLFADQNQLSVILTNLISNAIKFTYNGGKITIGANLQEGNMAEIFVRDTGTGMPQSVVDKIFRIDSKHTMKGTQGEAGTGLGLLLCREFVEKNGGKIWVESTSGVGSTFRFTVPLAS